MTSLSSGNSDGKEEHTTNNHPINPTGYALAVPVGEKVSV